MPPRTSHRVASRIRNCVPLLDCWTPRRPLSLRPQPGEQQQPEEASHIQLVLAPSLPAATSYIKSWTKQSEEAYQLSLDHAFCLCSEETAATNHLYHCF